MIPQYDIDYSLTREAAERVAAGSTADRCAREVHLALADRYADRAWSYREQRCADGDRC